MSAQGVFATILFIILLVIGLLFGIPHYNVWQQEMSGRAALAKASEDRQIILATAKAQTEAAKEYAIAEVARAEGLKSANDLLVGSFGGAENYLRYLWIDTMKNSNNQIIYVPMDGTLPVTESTRLLDKK